MQARKETRLSRAPAKALCSDRTPFLSRGQYAGTRNTPLRVPATETSSRRIFPEVGIPVSPFVAAFFGVNLREFSAFPRHSSPKVSAPPGHRRRSDHCLAAVSLASFRSRWKRQLAGRTISPGPRTFHAFPTGPLRSYFYLGHTPILQDFKHLADQARHRIPLRPLQHFPC